MSWTYSRNVHERVEVEELARLYVEELGRLIEHCREAEAGGYTPSDFPLAGLSQEGLDALVGERWREVEDIYPLSPMQQGLLFHSLYQPESGVYLEQISYGLEGELDEAAFERAWRQLMARHSILRTSFAWEGLREPLQVVHREAVLPLAREDWRGLGREEQEERLGEYLAQDRVRDFELGRAPLMRLSLIRLDEERYQFTWTFHHVLQDGWSGPLLLKDVLSYY